MGDFISSKHSSTLQSVDTENKCWIHTVDFSLIEKIDEERIIGFKKNEKTKNSYNNFFIGNDILLVTRNNDQFICYGYTKIDEIIKNDENPYEFYDHRYKFRIKRIKYFLEPVFIEDIRNNLNSIKSNGLLSDVLNIGYYKKISNEDKRIILKDSLLTGLFPVYMDNINMNMKEFIIDSIKSLHDILKIDDSKKLIEINEFIILLKAFLENYGINKDFEDLKRFYSRYAHELGFKHIPSREPEKFVVLITPSGKKKEFTYISLD